MSYIATLQNLLVPQKTEKQIVLDLFAGCGGLALGFEANGFETTGFEIEADYSDTYTHNLLGKCQQACLTTDYEFPAADIIIGGPPCQPFSVGGKQFGLQDSRDGFPAFIAAVRQVNPLFWLFENVRGLLYKNKWYFREIIEKLSALGYHVDYKLLNAVNFGVPQNRERVIVVGYKTGRFDFPSPSLYKTTSGEALGEWVTQAPNYSRFLTKNMDKYIAKYEKASQCINPRDLHLHKPARTLTCRNLAGSTGDMHRIKLPDGRRRQLFVSEAARLQSFPDWFEFKGSEKSQFYQIGNAVPPLFAYHLGRSVKDYLLNGQHKLQNASQRNTRIPYQESLFG